MKEKEKGASTLLTEFISGMTNISGGISRSMMALGFALVIAYISNHHEVQSRISQVDKLQKEITELRYEQVSIESRLMNMSKQSEVLSRVRKAGLGLEELTEPPRIIER